MKAFRAVIDTNVLYAGLYSSTGASHKILRMIDAGGIRPVLSSALLYEYEEILKRHRDLLALSAGDIEIVLNELCKRGESVPIHYLWRPQLPDPKDDHILELAVAANHAPIVTHNRKDFEEAEKFNVRILSPAELIKEYP